MAPIVTAGDSNLFKRYYYYYYYRPSSWYRYGRWVFLTFMLIFIALGIFFAWLWYVRRVKARKVVPGPNMLWAVPRSYMPSDNGQYPQTPQPQNPQYATDYQPQQFYKGDVGEDEYAKQGYTTQNPQAGYIDTQTYQYTGTDGAGIVGHQTENTNAPYSNGAYYNAEPPTSPPPQTTQPYQNASFSHVNEQYAPPAHAPSDPYVSKETDGTTRPAVPESAHVRY